MADLREDDLFLVNRNDTSATVQQSELMAKLQDDDYMIVNREDVTYKITGADLIDSVIDPLTLTPIVTPTNPEIGDLLTVDPNTAGGKSPFSTTYQWKYKETVVGTVEDYAGETGVTYQTVSSDEGHLIACEVTVTDSRGTTATELSAFTSAVIKPPSIVKPSIIAPANGAGEMVQAESDEITGWEEGTKTLTVASDKDLANFNAGDDVVQDSGYTPQTSAITGVQDALQTEGKVAWSSGLNVEPSWNNYPETTTFDTGSNSRIEYGSASHYGNNTSLQNWWSDNPNGPWTRDGSSGVTGPYDHVTTHRYLRFSLYGGDDVDTGLVEIISGTENTVTTLTLTDDTDLANFREGDEIKQDSMTLPGVTIDSVAGRVRLREDGGELFYDSTDPSLNDIALLQNNIAKMSWWDTTTGTATNAHCCYLSDASTTGSITFGYEGFSVGDKISLKMQSHSGAVAPVTHTVSGDVSESTFGPLTASGGAVETIQFTVTATTGTFTINTDGDGNEHVIRLYFISNYTVLPTGTISDISGNTITLSESTGTWDDSGTKYAIGPVTTPATGTVASTDTAANTMTLSVSDETYPKRWIANQGKFVKGEETPSQDAAPEVNGTIDVTPETDEITGWEEGTKTLTVASDKDLANFNAGDDVVQDSGHTPQTSAITGVTEIDQPYVSITSVTGSTGDRYTSLLTPDTAFSTGDQTSGNPGSLALSGEGFYYYLNIFQPGLVSFGAASSGDRDEYDVLLGWDDVNDQWIVRDKVVGPISSSNTLSASGELSQYWCVSSVSSSAYFSAVVGEPYTSHGLGTYNYNYSAYRWSAWVPEKIERILTLTDATDLENFRVGDVLSTGDTVTAIGPGNTLTVDGGTWNNGDVVTGPDTAPATGTVASLDPATNTITLSSSDESGSKRWIVNAGKTVLGPTIQVPANLKIYSSDFLSDPEGTLAHTQSDWQITLKEDTSYLSPVSQSLNDSTDLTVWEPSNLEEGTAYRCRVRHKSNNVVSEWSDDSTFKTADNSITKKAQPGNPYFIDSTGSDLSLRAGSTPSKFINMYLAQNYYGLGVDGNVYVSTDGSSFQEDTQYSGADALQIVAAYNDDEYFVLDKDGVLHEVGIDAATNIDTMTGVTNLVQAGATVGAVFALKGDGTVWGRSINGGTIYAGDFLFPDTTAWHDIGVSLPAGETILQMGSIAGGNYDVPGLALLTTSGNLYTTKSLRVSDSRFGYFPGLSSTGTNSNPALFQTGVKEISNIESTGNTTPYGGLSVLFESGELWISVGGSVSSFGATEISWQKLNNDTDWASSCMSGHSNSAWVALKSDGYYYGQRQGRDAITQIDYGAINPVPEVYKVGNLPGCNNRPSAPICILLNT